VETGDVVRSRVYFWSGENDLLYYILLASGGVVVGASKGNIEIFIFEDDERVVSNINR
jgi:hypothetical protein